MTKEYPIFVAKFNLTYFNMESIWNTINGNREECIKFLESQPDEKFVFAEYDKDEMEWMNPHSESEDKSCYVEDVAPFVTYADDDGNVSEYIVTAIYISHKESGDEFDVEMIDVNDYENCIDVPVTWLYGASECYIYEMMMDLKLVEKEG